MHDGSLSTLPDVIAHYATGAVVRPSVSALARADRLGEKDIEHLIAFLNSLSGTKQVISLPVLPN
jgi:cytochrome c peroxidase